MSLFGALRLFVTSRRDEPGDSLAPELTPIRPDAWSAWARAAEHDELLERPLGEACRTPDGRVGQIVAVFDGAEWRRACQVVPTPAS